MKLSDMSTDKALNVLCEITPHVSNIVEDTKIREELQNVAKPEFETVIQKDEEGNEVEVQVKKTVTRAEIMARGLNKITSLLPMLLKDHREDVLAIVGCVNDMSAEEVGAQNALVTMKQIQEVIKDKELMDFFTPSTDLKEE